MAEVGSREAELDDKARYLAGATGTISCSLSTSVVWAGVVGALQRASRASTDATRYDAAGRPVRAMNGHGTVTRSAYDALGRLTAATANYLDGVSSGAAAADDITSTFASDAALALTGYCPAVQVRAGGCDPASPSEDQTWHYEYDAAARPTVTAPPLNTSAVVLNLTETQYDAGGRVSKTCSYPAGGSCSGTSNTRTVTRTYDPVGRPTVATVAENGTTRLVTATAYNADASVGSEGRAPCRPRRDRGGPARPIWRSVPGRRLSA